jgi:hypothetical protein
MRGSYILLATDNFSDRKGWCRAWSQVNLLTREMRCKTLTTRCPPKINDGIIKVLKMTYLIFVAILILLFFIGSKVSEWQTVYRLGLKIEVPEKYLTHQNHYHATSWAIFFIAIIPLIFMPLWHAVAGGVLLIITRFAVAIRGRKKGVSSYKEALRESLNNELGHQGEKNEEWIKEQLNKSGSEIINEANGISQN